MNRFCDYSSYQIFRMVVAEMNAKKRKTLHVEDGKTTKKRKEKKGFLTKSERHEASNQQRLSSIKDKLKAQRLQQELVKKSLNSNEKLNTRVTFDSDDEDTSKSFSLANVSEMKGGIQLFADVPSDVEEEDNVFSARSFKNDKKGAKLMKLEEKYGLDKRFKLDDRFADSESDTEEQAPKENEHLKSEKERNLQLLHSVLGNKKSNKRKARSETCELPVRFDPDDVKHKQYEDDVLVQKKKKSTFDVYFRSIACTFT